MACTKSSSTAPFYLCVVIGAGPCGLSFVSRLLASASTTTVDDTYVDDEHARTSHHLHNGCRRGTKQKVTLPPNTLLVLDQLCRRPAQPLADQDGHPDTSSESAWLTQWHRQLSVLSIDYLRSPITWHCDPSSDQALRDTARSLSRRSSPEQPLLCEVSGAEGVLSRYKGRSRRRSATFNGHQKDRLLNESNRNNLFVPSTALFDHHAQQLAAHCHGMLGNGLVRQACQVVEVAPIIQHDESEARHTAFRVRMADGSAVIARHVVCCMGNSQPRLPAWSLPFVRSTSEPRPSPSASDDRSTARSNPTKGAMHRIQHVSAFCSDDAHSQSDQPILSALKSVVDSLPSPRCPESTRAFRVLIVGGGLSSAQLVDMLLSSLSLPSHVSHMSVSLYTRGQLRVRPFDLSLDWMGEARGLEMHRFYLADPSERLKIIQRARGGGGSITLDAHTKLLRWVNVDETATRRCHVQSHCHIQHVAWSAERNEWDVQWASNTTAAAEHGDRGVDGSEKGGGRECFDYIVLATGCQPNIRSLGLFHPTLLDAGRTEQGFPIVDHDLAWTIDPTALLRTSNAVGGTTVDGLDGLDGFGECPSVSAPGIFFSGAFAALQVGPTAFNLAGAQAASRILVDRLRPDVQALVALADRPDGRASRPNTQHQQQQQRCIGASGRRVAAIARVLNVHQCAANYFSVLTDG